MTLPLFLTTARIVLAVAVGALLVLENAVPFHVTIVAVCFIVAAATDYFDGRLARARRQETTLGAFLDPLADKLLVYLAFIYLTLVRVYPAWLLLVVFTRDIVTDSFRAFAAGLGHSMPANMVSKWKSFFQMLSIGLLLILVSIVELEQGTPFGPSLGPIVDASWFNEGFTATYVLMVAAAVVGIAGTVQYFVEHGPALFRRKKSFLRS